MSAGLRVLAVDDERPSLADLSYQLRAQPSIESVVEAVGATEALVCLHSEDFDAVFLDVRMPGLDGLELARVLERFKRPPVIVFVTAYESHAVEAFEIHATDYLLKPVRPERLAEAIRRVASSIAMRREEQELSDVSVPPEASRAVVAFDVGALSLREGSPAVTTEVSVSMEDSPELITVESGGRIRVIDRRDVQYVASSGDYVRLYAAGLNVLLRTSLAVLEERWKPAGFVRIHRSFLVAIDHIDEVRIEPHRTFTVVVNGRQLPVSRRMGRTLRAQLTGEVALRSVSSKPTGPTVLTDRNPMIDRHPLTDRIR
jgi:DNA-binding LytR/AlgR family response regulator